MPAAATCDAAQDEWTLGQKGVVALVALAIVFDGLDTQVIGFAAPELIREWGISKQTLAPMLAIGLIGMMIGTGIGGLMGDRFGRRLSLIVSTVTFGAATAAMAGADRIETLFFLRLLAGLGLGAVLPNAAAMTAEFTPARLRSIAVTLSIACVPLGGVAGGAVAAVMLPSFGWRGLFMFAGVAPLLLAALFALKMPESPAFLAARASQSARPSSGQSRSAAPARRLFGKALALDTIGIWIAFFASLSAVYLSFNWLPTMMVDAGFSVGDASIGLLAFNLGGVVLAIATAGLAVLIGSRIPLLALSLTGVCGAILLFVSPLDPGDRQILTFLRLALQGGCVAGLQTVLYALAANIYSTDLRATGVGAAAAVGRIGAITITILGALILKIAGAAGFYVAMAASLATAASGIALVRNHIGAGRQGH